MAETAAFAIRRAFLIPLGILLALCLTLFAVTLAQGEPTGKVVILGFIILPVAGLFIESAFRRTRIDADRVTILKFLRQRTLLFADITAVETVQVRKRAFLTLCAEDDFLILSNAYGDFPRMTEMILERVPPAAISDETRQMAAAPPRKSTDIFSCWLAVLLLSLILYIQLGGHF